MKRLIAITITAIMLLLPSQALADSKGTLSYERAVALLKLNNGTLRQLQKAENDAYEQYQSNLLEMAKIDVNGFSAEFNGQKIYITYGAETRLAMTKMKELVPEQMKFAWESTRDNRIVTENTLKTALRGIFFGLFSAQSDLQLKQKQLSLAKDQNTQDEIKLKKGMISELDLEESGYNLLKAQKDVVAANRNYENAVRSFNQFIGLGADEDYTQVLFEETSTRPVLKPVEFYTGTALANRLDIVSLQKQLAMKEHDKRLTDTGFAKNTSTSAQESYERLLTDIDQLNMNLESAKLTITDEIRNAYADIISSGKGLDSMYKTLKLQRSNYEKMQTRYKAGVISRNILTQTEIGLLQVENGYKAMLFDYKTKILRLNYATGIGPGY